MLNLDYFYIPPLPENLLLCLSYLYNSELDYDVLLRKITTDIGITEKILSVANSQYFSQGAISTNNLKQAVTRIGVANLIEILSREYYNSVFKKVDVDFFTLRDFNRHSSYVSKLAVVLGKLAKVENTNDLMIAGLFHDVGLLARSYCQNTVMKSIVTKCKQEKIDFYSAELSEKIPTHEELGRRVANKWNLNERITNLIEHHHQDILGNKPLSLESSVQTEIDILVLADTISHSMKCGFKDYTRNVKINKNILDKLGLRAEEVSNKTKEVFSSISTVSY